MSIRDKMEYEVMRRVRENGGFSVFWVTSNRLIAAAADRLEKSGAIVRDNPIGQFPWCAYVVGVKGAKQT